MRALYSPGFAGQAPYGRRGWIIAVLLAGCMTRAWAAPASSDATDAASNAVPGAAAPLQEVIVHPRRREEKIQDVPLAVTVESGRQLEEQSAVSFEDAVREAPNVLAFKSARSVSALEVTMRGQTAIPSSIVYD